MDPAYTTQSTTAGEEAIQPDFSPDTQVYAIRKTNRNDYHVKYTQRGSELQADIIVTSTGIISETIRPPQGSGCLIVFVFWNGSDWSFIEQKDHMFFSDLNNTGMYFETYYYENSSATAVHIELCKGPGLQEKDGIDIDIFNDIEKSYINGNIQGIYRKIKIENTGADWISMRTVTLSNYLLKAPVRILGLSRNNEAILWVQNSQSDWHNAYQDIKILPAKNISFNCI